MTQFPVVPSFASTGHKCQGKTLNHAIISSFSTTPGWSYVALSRVLTKFTYFPKSAKTQEIYCFEQRLEVCHRIVAQKLNQSQQRAVSLKPTIDKYVAELFQP